MTTTKFDIDKFNKSYDQMLNDKELIDEKKRRVIESIEHL